MSKDNFIKASGTTDVMSSGVIEVKNPAIRETSTILYSRKTLGGSSGNVAISAQADGAFTLTSESGSETSTFDYMVYEN